jgi:hypothetical protein
VAEPCELVVLLSGSTDAAARLAEALPGISFAQLPAPSEEGAGDWYLTARMDDRHTAEDVARRVGAMPGVQAAYVKPPGEPPGQGS